MNIYEVIDAYAMITLLSIIGVMALYCLYTSMVYAVNLVSCAPEAKIHRRKDSDNFSCNLIAFVFLAQLFIMLLNTHFNF